MLRLPEDKLACLEAQGGDSSALQITKLGGTRDRDMNCEIITVLKFIFILTASDSQQEECKLVVCECHSKVRGIYKRK